MDEANREHGSRHGVSIQEIEALLAGNPRVAPHLEGRLVAVGRNHAGRSLFVAFTIRERSGQRFIRPTSARHMHAREVKAYEAKVPGMATDEEAEAFLQEDLSDLDFSQFKPAHFELAAK